MRVPQRAALVAGVVTATIGLGGAGMALAGHDATGGSPPGTVTTQQDREDRFDDRDEERDDRDDDRFDDNDRFDDRDDRDDDRFDDRDDDQHGDDQHED